MSSIEEIRFTTEDGKDDLLCRKELAQALIKSCTRNTQLFPIILHGSWGSGKSVFCHQLKNLIVDEENENLNVIYINAFMFDYTNEPFLMILGNILETIDNTKHKQKLSSIASKLIKTLVRQSANIALTWIEDKSKCKIKNLYNSLKEACKGEENIAIDEILASFGQMSTQISSFKKVLQLSLGDTHTLVIIDELDRCKPSFALEILERVKHIFDIPKLHFLLSMNMKILEAMLKKQYGYEQNSEEYLQKFYRCKIELPTRVERENADVAFILFLEKIQQETDFWNHLSNHELRYPYSRQSGSARHGKDDISETQHAILVILQWCIEEHRVTLRDIEHFIFNIRLYYTFQKLPTEFKYASLELYALFLYTVNKPLFYNLMNTDLELQKYKDILGTINKYSGLKKEYIMILFTYTVYATNPSPTFLQEYIAPFWGTDFAIIDEHLSYSSEKTKKVFNKIENTLYSFSQS